MGGHYGREGVTPRMEQLKTTRKVLTEMNESYLDLLRATKETTRDIHATQQLWRAGNKSRLIKIGIALVIFPEPTPPTMLVFLRIARLRSVSCCYVFEIRKV